MKPAQFSIEHALRNLIVAWWFAGVERLVLAQSAPGGSAIGGGLAKAQSVADQAQTALLGIAGSLAVVYLLYVGIMAFSERKPWSDFGWGVVHVAVVGASVAIGRWAWALFS